MSSRSWLVSHSVCLPANWACNPTLDANCCRCCRTISTGLALNCWSLSAEKYWIGPIWFWLDCAFCTANAVRAKNAHTMRLHQKKTGCHQSVCAVCLMANCTLFTSSCSHACARTHDLLPEIVNNHCDIWKRHLMAGWQLGWGPSMLATCSYITLNNETKTA